MNGPTFSKKILASDEKATITTTTICVIQYLMTVLVLPFPSPYFTPLGEQQNKLCSTFARLTVSRASQCLARGVLDTSESTFSPDHFQLYPPYVTRPIKLHYTAMVDKIPAGLIKLI